MNDAIINTEERFQAVAFYLICRKDLLALYFMREVSTNSGVQSITLRESNFPVTEEFKQREVSVAWMQQRDWDIRWDIRLDQLAFNIPTKLEMI